MSGSQPVDVGSIPAGATKLKVLLRGWVASGRVLDVIRAPEIMGAGTDRGRRTRLWPLSRLYAGVMFNG